MSNRLKRNWPLLLLLEKASPKLRNELLSDLESSQDFCKLIEEIFSNLIKGNILLSREAERKVRAERKLCKELATFQKLFKTKPSRKKKIKQAGGFLPFLLPLINNMLTD
jgi:hypothetical protein